MKQAGDCVHHRLLFDMHVGGRFFAALQSRIDVEERVFDVSNAWVGSVRDRRHRLCRRARLRRRRLLVVVLAVHQSMARSSALDLAQSYQIAPFEIAISMLEFPEGRFRVSCVEYIAHCNEVSMTAYIYGRGYWSAPLWNPYMLSWRTNDEMFVCLKY